MRIDPGTADKILDMIYNHDYAQASSAEVAQALHIELKAAEDIFSGIEQTIPALIKTDKSEDGFYIRINTDHYLQFWGFIDTGGFQTHPELLQPLQQKARNTWLLAVLFLLLLILIAYLGWWLY